MKKEISYGNFFKSYGIFLGILAVFFGLLIYLSVLSQKSWRNNLRNSVSIVLNENEPESWNVGNFCPIQSPISFNSACYEIQNKKNGEYYKAIILRVQTFYGPLSAVFTIDKDNVVEFKGYSSLHGRVANQIENSNSNKRINYWKSKIPEIIQYTK